MQEFFNLAIFLAVITFISYLFVLRQEWNEEKEAVAKKRELERKKTPAQRGRECFDKAEEYAENNEIIRAIFSLDEAIKYDPKATYYNKRGFYRKKNNQIGKALVDFSKAIELQPIDTTYRLNRGLLYIEIDETELACADWKVASEEGSKMAKDYLDTYCKVEPKKEEKEIEYNNTKSRISKTPEYAHQLKNSREHWKPITGYDNKYWISTLGRVESLWDSKNPRILKTDSNNGWPRVDLVKDLGNERKKTRKSVAFLIAEHFLDNPYRYRCIDILDNDFKNVQVDNIRWVRDAYSPSYEKTPYVKTYTP